MRKLAVFVLVLLLIKLVAYLGNDEDVVIPSGVKIVSNTTTRPNNFIKSVFIPNTVTEIQNGAFTDSVNLTTVIFEEGSVLEIIKDGAFSYCDLVSIILPDSLKQIGVNAFRANRNMNSMVFGSGLQSVGDYAFSELKNISITFLCETPPTFGEDPFLDSQDVIIYVPADSIDAYIAALGPNVNIKPIE